MIIRTGFNTDKPQFFFSCCNVTSEIYLDDNHSSEIESEIQLNVSQQTNIIIE